MGRELRLCAALVGTIVAVSSALAIDPGLTYNALFEPPLSSPAWTAENNPTGSVVADLDASNGFAYELSSPSRRMSFAIYDSQSPSVLDVLDNTVGWVAQVRHHAISNDKPSLETNNYSDQNDTLFIVDGEIGLAIDFRPGEVRVQTQGGSGFCNDRPSTCVFRTVPLDEYVTVEVRGQGTLVEVLIEGHAPVVLEDTQGAGEPALIFGSTVTGVPDGFAARWDYISVSPPGAAVLTSAGDTYLKQGKPNKNQGTEEILRLRQSGKNRPLVEFSQGEILSAVGSASVASATLRLHIDFNANNWGNSGREVGVHRMTDLWTELGATWKCGIDADTSNQQPNCDPQWVMQNSSLWPFEDATDTVLHEKFQTGWVEFDVTADVQAFVDGSAANLGWIIKKVNEGQAGHVQYSSREGDNPPELVIVTQ